jgi:TIR domain
VKRLHGRMQQEHLRVWCAPEDMKGGRKSLSQIDEAIRVHDKLLLVLSENSMESDWVKLEIRKARKLERETGTLRLFPVSLLPFTRLRDWECIDSDTGEDLAAEVRIYHIPSFSDWKEHDAFEANFKKLLSDLRASVSAPDLRRR